MIVSAMCAVCMLLCACQGSRADLGNAHFRMLMEKILSAAQAMMLCQIYSLTHCHLGQPSLARLYQVRDSA